MLSRKLPSRLKNSRKYATVLVISLCGLLVAAIIFIIRLGRKRNPEKWIAKVLTDEGFGSAEVNYWKAVARLETDNFTNLLTKYYNIFSMTVPKQRPSLRNGQVYDKGDGQYMSTYSDFRDAVRDLVIWLEYTKFPTSITNLDTFVNEMKKRGYFTTSQESYKERLQQILGQMGLLGGGGSFGGSGTSDSWFAPLTQLTVGGLG